MPSQAILSRNAELGNRSARLAICQVIVLTASCRLSAAQDVVEELLSISADPLKTTSAPWKSNRVLASNRPSAQVYKESR